MKAIEVLRVCIETRIVTAFFPTPQGLTVRFSRRWVSWVYWEQPSRVSLELG